MRENRFRRYLAKRWKNHVILAAMPHRRWKSPETKLAKRKAVPP